MKTIRYPFFVWISVCLFIAPPIFADTLIFVNDTTISGTVLQTNDDEILLLSDDAAFNYKKSNLKEIKIEPLQVSQSIKTERLGDYAFSACPSLGNILIPDSVSAIGDMAFNPCLKLASVVIGNDVTRIGKNAFGDCIFTNIVIPANVTYIGDGPFYNCTNLLEITVNTNNHNFISVNGVLFDVDQNMLIQYPGGKTGQYHISNSVTSIGNYAFAQCLQLTGVSIPNSLTNIGSFAFYYCTGLTSLIIPNSVTSIGTNAFDACTHLANVSLGSGISIIGDLAFASCTNLTAMYFQGNAPSLAGLYVYYNDTNLTIYYICGTSGWSATYGSIQTSPWNAQAQTTDGSFGVQTNQFGFNINGSSNLVIVVEASTNLFNPSWQLVQTNTLIGGTAYFSDPQWTNYPARFYRFRSP